METQAEDKVSSEQPDLDDVLEKINEIAKASATGDYIYRGEPAHYQEHPYDGSVTARLYRHYLDREAEDFDVADVETRTLWALHNAVDLHGTTDFEILVTNHHFGDKTNLIAFTTDFLVALFFACERETEKPGRVILLRSQPEVDLEAYEVKELPRTIPHVAAQKSIFVHTLKGFVEPDSIVNIPAHLKAPLLEYLRNQHDVSTETLYNDLQVFLRGNPYEPIDDCEPAVTDFNTVIDLAPTAAGAYNNRGLTYADMKDLASAIADYHREITLAPEDAGIYCNRGLASRHKGDFEAAIEDYNRAIALDPGDARFYFNRGEAWLHLKEWHEAKTDLTTAKDMDCDTVESFYNDYESVEDFEARNEVKLPEDIAALLQGK